MKKIIFSIHVLFSIMSITFGQTIPNGNFENWNKFLFEYPAGYPFNSAKDAAMYYGVNLPSTIEKVTDAYDGSYAVKLSSHIVGTDSIFGYFVNTNPDNDPDHWHGGFALTEKPTGITGFYKANFVANDSAIIVVNFNKNGSSIGTYVYKIGGNTSSYTSFSFTFNPPLPATPDSVQLGYVCGDPFNQIIYDGSWIILDKISFTGISTQPVGMNGSFENWETDSVLTLKDWYVNSNPKAISRTTDAYMGTYAVSIETLSDNQGGIDIGAIGTGQWTYLGLVGGKPYTLTKDTLVLAYKYFPQNNDSAFVELFFKGNNYPNPYGVSFILTNQNTYTVAELPFELFSAPDTLVIFLASSYWQHQNNPIYAGSTLFADKIFLKSEPNVSVPDVAKQKNVTLYPNPASEILRVNASDEIKEIHLYSADGKLLQSFVVNEKQFSIPVQTLPEGNYFIKIQFQDMDWIKPWMKK
jgi:hypothetical protein